MRSLLLILAGAVLLCRALPAEGPITPVKTVEPDWGPELSKSYLVNPTRVEMIIDRDGEPFTLTGGGSLPDAAIHALMQWRYPEAATPYSVTFNMPLRTAIVESSFRRRWWPSKKLLDDFKASAALDAAAAAAVERSLADRPGDIDARSTLVRYFAITGNQPVLAAQVLWLIQNRPDADILGSPLAIINTDEIRKAWLDHVSNTIVEPAVVANAVNFLRVADAARAEQLLGADSKSVDEISLGDLYGMAILGVTAIDGDTGLPSSGGSAMPNGDFALKARDVLAKTNDVRLMLTTMNTLRAGAYALAKAGHLPDGYAKVCEELLADTRRVYPDTAASCDPNSATTTAAPSTPQRIRVGGNVQAANLVKKVVPTYPLEAKQRGIQGTVRFNVVIGKDGAIEHLIFVSGPFALYDAARAAVLQWQYWPTTLNGLPVEVVTTIDVNFVLSRYQM